MNIYFGVFRGYKFRQFGFAHPYVAMILTRRSSCQTESESDSRTPQPSRADSKSESSPTYSWPAKIKVVRGGRKKKNSSTQPASKQRTETRSRRDRELQPSSARRRRHSRRRWIRSWRRWPRCSPASRRRTPAMTSTPASPSSRSSRCVRAGLAGSVPLAVHLPDLSVPPVGFTVVVFGGFGVGISGLRRCWKMRFLLVVRWLRGYDLFLPASGWSGDAGAMGFAVFWSFSIRF